MKLDKQFIAFVFIALLTIIAWQIPGGRYVFYPFTILGTWFHEMGHGITALILGGNFIKLIIFADASGLAYHSGILFLGGFGQALVAMGGPLGPVLAGSLFLIATKKENLNKLILFVLGVFQILSVAIWVRSWIGAILILLFGFSSIAISLTKSVKAQKYFLQFLGIQAYMSVFLSIGYLFSSGGMISGNSFKSDTSVIENYLLLPYWFWGGTIILVWLVCFYFSIKILYSSPSPLKKQENL